MVRLAGGKQSGESAILAMIKVGIVSSIGAIIITLMAWLFKGC